ncbi:threonine synthase [Dongshaea marina]|uniref:threonine synthase n=1 Tax=Dongshaea marina TaxID=2047966 RepID=UPI000D3E6D97|nr:threonine synthase [Dongshaea marina]
MLLYNLKHPEQEVSFAQAVRLGLGRDKGLFFPKLPEPMADIPSLLKLPFVERSTRILHHLIGDEIPFDTLQGMVARAFDFSVPLAPVTENTFALELYHGPTLAFKDFGARFMAECLQHFYPEQPVTILTATSGDTGAAVAHAFWNKPGVEVVVLYPGGRISRAQEHLFCTLGGNIRTYAVAGDFDSCQALVRHAFSEPELVSRIHLNSANSINVSRLFAQICYYFEALAQLPSGCESPVIAVPSGNFGNLTAALLAKALGLPVKRLVAATNSNDTVPRYLDGQGWEVRSTQATLSCSMDVSDPNNWPRVEALFALKGWSWDELGYGRVDEQQTREAVKTLRDSGYLAEPHGAVAWRVLQDELKPGETGVFLATAHPAKFATEVAEITGVAPKLPAALESALREPLLSKPLAADFEALLAEL